VVNDGGASLENLRNEFDRGRFRFLDQKNTGPALARNRGVAEAKGRKILFLDDDCEAHENWVEQMTLNLKAKSLLAGKTINKSRAFACSEASQVLLDYLMLSLKGTTEYFFTSNNLGVGKEDFHQLGGFDGDFKKAAGEDREFCVRAHFQGYTLERCLDAQIEHSHELSFRRFLKMHFKYGNATHTYKNVKKKRAITYKTLRIRGFHLKMLWYPLSLQKYHLPYRVYLSWLIGWSQVATLAGFLAAKIQRH